MGEWERAVEGGGCWMQMDEYVITSYGSLGEMRAGKVG